MYHNCKIVYFHLKTLSYVKFFLNDSIYFIMVSLFYIEELLDWILLINSELFINFSPIYFNLFDLHIFLNELNEAISTLKFYIHIFYYILISFNWRRSLNFFMKIVLKFIFSYVVSSFRPLKIRIRLNFYYSLTSITLFILFYFFINSFTKFAYLVVASNLYSYRSYSSG